MAMESTVLECLAAGVNAIWCGGFTREGEGCGYSHYSLTTVANPIRLGNKDAESRFNLTAFRREVIKATPSLSQGRCLIPRRSSMVFLR
jgi:hypothetical protein